MSEYPGIDDRKEGCDNFATNQRKSESNNESPGGPKIPWQKPWQWGEEGKRSHVNQR